MIIAARTDAKFLLEPSWYNTGLARLPQHLQQRIRAYRLPQDRAVRLAARLLLGQLLDETGTGAEQAWDALHYTTAGRPVFRDLPVQFSTAHSGMEVWVTLARQGAVGIDVEEIRPVDLAFFRSYFQAEEWDMIHTAARPLPVFYRLWTRKEAVLKAVGTGVTDALAAVCVAQDRVMYDNRTWQLLTLLETAQHCVHLATDVPDAAYKVITIPPERLVAGMAGLA